HGIRPEAPSLNAPLDVIVGLGKTAALQDVHRGHHAARVDAELRGDDELLHALLGHDLQHGGRDMDLLVAADHGVLDDVEGHDLRRERRTGPTDHAADDAAHLTAGHTALDPAFHARILLLLLFLLVGLRLLGRLDDLLGGDL